MLKTLSDVRQSFWDNHVRFQPAYKAKYRQNDYNIDTRMAFCDWVDYLCKSNQITEKLGNRATLWILGERKNTRE